ncbi:hypothetical protein [Lysinibacillus sp. Y5S-8]
MLQDFDIVCAVTETTSFLQDWT